LVADAENAPLPVKRHELDVPGVGVIAASKPMPFSAAALAMTANAKISLDSQLGYLNLFVRNHIGDEAYENLLVRMMNGELGSDALGRVARAIATWGTSRPTSPSSH
jgi:hypothetical protein